MHKGVAVLCSQLVCVVTCLVEYISVQYNLRSIASGAVHLHERSRGRHHDGSRNASQLCRVGYALGMVSCRRSDQSPLFFFLCQGTDLIVSAAYLVSAGVLHVLRLKVYLVSGCSRKILTVNQFGFLGDLLNLLGSLLKFFEG